MMSKMMGGMKKDKSADGEGGGMKSMGFDITPDMLQMMNGFTVLRLISLMGAANIHFTEEQLLDLNEKFNKIKKPKKK